MTFNEPLANEAIRQRRQFIDAVKDYPALFSAHAVILIVLGLLAILFPLVTTVALSFLVGWTLLLAGVAHLVAAVALRSTEHFWLEIILAGATAVTGALALMNPDVSIRVIGLLMVVFFMFDGLTRIAYGFMIRPVRFWGVFVLAGVLGVCLGAYLLFNPELKLAVLGTLIGLLLLGEGIAVLKLARAHS